MTPDGQVANGLVCPTPARASDQVLLGHGSGGTLSAALLRDHFLPHLANPTLAALGDGAVLDRPDGRVVISTDTFVVSPLEFPGGDIGALAVHGTLNDVAMMGAEPRWLSAGFVLEEGLPLVVLDRILASMSAAARGAGVPVVAGDTKVVERGRADGMYLNTTGIGIQYDDFRPAPNRAQPGDAVIVSGPIARHGMAIMAVREGLGFQTTITSDTACLLPLTRRLRERVGNDIHVLRDPTRGGIASALNELAQTSRVGIALDARTLPIPEAVNAACALLGLDPLYVASEGVLLALAASDRCADALEALRDDPLGADAVQIGVVTSDHPGLVVLRTPIGGRRIVDLLTGDQLPRIC
jgi:hydrogenase expression/formation protein HypE